MKCCVCGKKFVPGDTMLCGKVMYHDKCKEEKEIISEKEAEIDRLFKENPFYPLILKEKPRRVN